MATTIDSLKKDWSKGHDILFEYNGKEMFLFHQSGWRVLCDDGRKCKSRAIVTKDDIFQCEYNSEKIEDILKKSEIKYIY